MTRPEDSTMTTPINLTENESIALNMLAYNLYNPANGGRPENYNDIGDVWTLALDDTTSTVTIKGRTLSGTISSLVSKGLVSTYDDTRTKAERRGEPSASTTGLTERGFDVWRTHVADRFAPVVDEVR